MTPVATADDFGTTYHDAETGRALLLRGDTMQYVFAEGELPKTPQSATWAWLQSYLIQNGYIQRGNVAQASSVQTGPNDGWVVEYSTPLNGWDWPTVTNAHRVTDWRQALKDADNGGGWVEVVSNIGLSAAVSAAAWNLAGSLTTDGFSLGAEATEEITVSMTETTGANTVGETGLEWYSVDPGPDPFATTADVNAGWSFDGGYPGVDWYNSAGIGEAAASNSLDSILGSINKVSSTVNTAIRALSGTAAQVRNNLAQQQPNYTRAAGGINLGLLAVGLLAWKLL